jgi:hypothetical protein
MPQIVLTEEQLRIVNEAGGAVDVVDGRGQPIASMRVLDAHELEAIERFRRNGGNQGPGVPAEQVQAHFRRLEEIRQKEGMDLPKALDLLRRMRAGEEV